MAFNQTTLLVREKLKGKLVQCWPVFQRLRHSTWDSEKWCFAFHLFFFHYNVSRRDVQEFLQIRNQWMPLVLEDLEVLLPIHLQDPIIKPLAQKFQAKIQKWSKQEHKFEISKQRIEKLSEIFEKRLRLWSFFFCSILQ